MNLTDPTSVDASAEGDHRRRTDAILGGRLREVWPIRERIPTEHEIMAYRVLDHDREDIDALTQRLIRPLLQGEREAV